MIRRLRFPKVPAIRLMRLPAASRWNSSLNTSPNSKNNHNSPQKFKIPESPTFPEKSSKTEYEFPQNPKYNIPLHVQKKSNDNFFIRHRRYIPIIVAVVVGGWGLYTVYFFTNPDAGKSLEQQKLLSPDYFTEFIITNKKQINKDHFLVELTPKHKDDLRHKYFSKKGFWDGSRLWSVEVKQPEIMVVRRYTPLPLVLENVPASSSNNNLTGDNGSTNTVLRIPGEESDTAKFCLYLKKYDHGEVARWISKKPIGAVLELRGPFTEFEFPAQPIDGCNKAYQRPKMANIASKVAADPFAVGADGKPQLPPSIAAPDNLAFYAAGTGIAPALQLLLSENPFKGHMWLHYSYRHKEEVPEEFSKFFYFLEKMDRLTLKTYEDSQSQWITVNDVPTPGVPNEAAIAKDESIEKLIKRQKLIDEKLKQLKEGKTEESNDASLKDSSADAALAAKSFEESSQDKTIIKKNLEPTTSSVKKVTSSITDDGPLVYTNALHQAYKLKDQPKSNPTRSIVCGPDGYVAYVAGAKPTEITQGPVAGLLGSKGWDNSNVYKM